MYIKDGKQRINLRLTNNLIKESNLIYENGFYFIPINRAMLDDKLYCYCDDMCNDLDWYIFDEEKTEYTLVITQENEKILASLMVQIYPPEWTESEKQQYLSEVNSEFVDTWLYFFDQWNTYDSDVRLLQVELSTVETAKLSRCINTYNSIWDIPVYRICCA